MQRVLQRYRTDRDNATKDSMLLDANEHPTQWASLHVSALLNLNRYPDSKLNSILVDLIAKNNKGLSSENIVLTAGSIAGIDLLIDYVNPETVILNKPTYDLYSQRSVAKNKKVLTVQLDADYQPDVQEILKLNNEASLLVLIHPNNPTGNLMDYSKLQQLIAEFKGKIIIDEAYIEYSGLNYSYYKQVIKNQNIFVLRTFSKAWGLAGARIGYVLCESSHKDSLEALKQPYSVSSIGLEAAVSAMTQMDKLESEVKSVLKQKSLVFERLSTMGYSVENTQTNFLIIKSRKSDHMARILSENSIVVRPRSILGTFNDCIRVTVGSSEENELLLRVLSDLKE